MKKKFVLRFAESCLFLALLCAVVLAAGNVTERKKSRNLFGAFLEDPGQYDVLFFGDSRFMNGMLPLDMWEDYGVAGYNLSCYGNTMPVSYWSMMNAFDYAVPELVVIAVNGIDEEKKITFASGDVHTALDFWPLSPTKARAVDDLLYDPDDPDFKDDNGDLYRDLKWEFLFSLGKYHSRWSELTKDDFAWQNPGGRGGEMLIDVLSYWDYDIIDEEEYAEEFGYGYSYLRAMIEECQSRGVDVMLLNMPALPMINEQKHANTVRSVADEYGIDYVDLSRLDCVVDYTVDCYDQQPHLNVSGSQKMTTYLGSYIKERYGLPDHRGEARYQDWGRQLEAYLDQKMKTMLAQQKLSSILMLLHDRDYDFRLWLSGDSPVYYDEQAILLMHNIARERVLYGEEYSKWSNSMYPLEIFDEALWEGAPYYLSRIDGEAAECMGEAAEQMAANAFESHHSAAVVIEVIDRRTGSPIGQMRF